MLSHCITKLTTVDPCLMLVHHTAMFLMTTARAPRTRRFRKTRATSIHLFGAGKQAIMEKMVHLVTNLTSTAEHCAHYMEASDVVGMYEEVYAAGKACPCGVMIWNDVQKVLSMDSSCLPMLLLLI